MKIAEMKNEFVRAYQYEFGATKKKALSVWNEQLKSNNDRYLHEIIAAYRNDTYKSFYND